MANRLGYSLLCLSIFRLGSDEVITMSSAKNISKIITIGICFLVSATAFAQKRNIYYLKNNGKEVSTKDSADYIRVVSEPDSGTALYNFQEFYPSGKPKFIGKSSEIYLVALEGPCVEFYSSGKRKKMATYRNGRKVDDVYHYYPNGKLYSVTNYFSGKVIYLGKPTPSDLVPTIHFVTCNDSTGKALITNGNGYYIGYDDNFKLIEEEGPIKNGLKDGDWKGNYVYGQDSTLYKGLEQDSWTFTEKYRDGNLITGLSIDKTGKTYSYTERHLVPEYVGGQEALGRFLQKNISYPITAKRRNIQGKVYLQFFIEVDGSLTNITAVSSPDNDLSKEAIRVMNLSPRWKPGELGGKPVSVKFTMPINFAMGD